MNSDFIPLDLLELIARGAFEAMVKESETDDLIRKAYAKGYLIALNDFSTNIKTFLLNPDSKELKIVVHSYSKQEGVSDESN